MIEWKAPEGKRSARKQGSPEQETGCGEAAKAREKGVYYLQFSSKTEEEMRRKLAEQGFSPASVDSAVKFLKERRYLNDEDYARRYLEKNGKNYEDVEISVSIGIVMRSGEREFGSLYEAADRALYQVKNRGKGGYMFADGL